MDKKERKLDELDKNCKEFLIGQIKLNRKKYFFLSVLEGFFEGVLAGSVIWFIVALVQNALSDDKS